MQMSIMDRSPRPMQHFGDPDLASSQFTYSCGLSDGFRAPGSSTEVANTDKTISISISEPKWKKSYSLLDLPIEIRLKIYHQLGFCTNHRRKMQTSRFLAGEVPTRASYSFLNGTGSHHRRNTQRPLGPLVKGNGISTQIMSVCQQISNETYELLYGDTDISFLWDMASERGWYVGKSRPVLVTPRDPLMAALPFAPEVLSAFMGMRAMSFLTHVTVGPLTFPDFAEPLQIYIRMLDYISTRCRKLKFLGIHLADKVRIPLGGSVKLEPLIEAIGNVVRCCPVEKIWVGTSRHAHESLDVALVKHLIRKTKPKSLEEVLAHARRCQIRASKDLLKEDESLKKATEFFLKKRANLETLLSKDYRIRFRKQEILDKMNDILTNWRRDFDTVMPEWVPQNLMVPMQVQFSSFQSLIEEQRIFASRMLALQQHEAIVSYIIKQQSADLNASEQRIIEPKIRHCLDARKYFEQFHLFTSIYHTTLFTLHITKKGLSEGIPDGRIKTNLTKKAKNQSPLCVQVEKRHKRITDVLPDVLTHLDADFDMDLYTTPPSPVEFAVKDTSLEPGTEEFIKWAERSDKRIAFNELRELVLAKAASALEANTTGLKIQNMTTADAQEHLTDHLVNLMKNMGFREATPKQKVAGAGAGGKEGISMPLH